MKKLLLSAVLLSSSVFAQTGGLLDTFVGKEVEKFSQSLSENMMKQMQELAQSGKEPSEEELMKVMNSMFDEMKTREAEYKSALIADCKTSGQEEKACTCIIEKQNVGELVDMMKVAADAGAKKDEAKIKELEEKSKKMQEQQKADAKACGIVEKK